MDVSEITVRQYYSRFLVLLVHLPHGCSSHYDTSVEVTAKSHHQMTEKAKISNNYDTYLPLLKGTQNRRVFSSSANCSCRGTGSWRAEIRALVVGQSDKETVDFLVGGEWSRRLFGTELRDRKGFHRVATSGAIPSFKRAKTKMKRQMWATLFKSSSKPHAKKQDA